jgi:hypothetical protein
MAGLTDVPAATSAYGKATLPLASDADRPLCIEFTWQPATPATQPAEATAINAEYEAERRPLELVWSDDQ